MNHGEVRKILTPVVSKKLNSEVLVCSLEYVSACAGEERGTLDGNFTADQLEAIAYWMRHPEEFKVTYPITKYSMECESEEAAQEAVEVMVGLEVWPLHERSDKPISKVKSVERDGVDVCIHLTDPVTVPTTIVMKSNSHRLLGMKGYRGCTTPKAEVERIKRTEAVVVKAVTKKWLEG